MDASMLTDDACERLISGRLTEEDAPLAEVSWFLEDIRSLFGRPVPTAVRMMHPSAVTKPAGSVFWPPETLRTCKPPRSWWQLSWGGPASGNGRRPPS
jgi:hypothetical protein